MAIPSGAGSDRAERRDDRRLRGRALALGQGPAAVRARRSATSPACCARLAYAAETAARDVGERFDEGAPRIAGWPRRWRSLVETFLSGPMRDTPAARRSGSRTRPPRALAPPSSRQGALRDRLRGQQPARLDRNPVRGVLSILDQAGAPMADQAEAAAAARPVAARRRPPKPSPRARAPRRRGSGAARRRRDRRGRARRSFAVLGPHEGPRPVGDPRHSCPRRAPLRESGDGASRWSGGTRRLLRRPARRRAAGRPTACGSRSATGIECATTLTASDRLDAPRISIAPPARSAATPSLASLGAHRTTLEGVAGFGFAVWAPNARRA